jgi:hypothetical protein
MACVNHAITITMIINQILAEKDILTGWHEVIQWQWDATLSLIGYILAYPIAPSTPSARNALSTAIEVFDLLGHNFTSARSVPIVTRDLAAKADLLIDRFRRILTVPYASAI